MGEGDGDGGIAHGQILVEFAETLLGDDEQALASARAALKKQMGDAALVDTAAVAALFNAIDRLADASGIPLEPEKAAATADFRSELGINDFESMRHRPAYE